MIITNRTRNEAKLTNNVRVSARVVIQALIQSYGRQNMDQETWHALRMAEEVSISGSDVRFGPYFLRKTGIENAVFNHRYVQGEISSAETANEHEMMLALFNDTLFKGLGDLTPAMVAILSLALDPDVHAGLAEVKAAVRAAMADGKVRRDDIWDAARATLVPDEADADTDGAGAAQEGAQPANEPEATKPAEARKSRRTRA